VICSCREASDATCVSPEIAQAEIFSKRRFTLAIDEIYHNVDTKNKKYVQS
jgi:hypothetical protein